MGSPDEDHPDETNDVETALLKMLSDPKKTEDAQQAQKGK